MTKPIAGGGYDGSQDLIRIVKGIATQVEEQGKTSGTDIVNDDGTTVIVADNVSYYQVNVVVGNTAPTGLNSSTQVGTVWYDTSTDPYTIKWWDGFGFQSYTAGQKYHGGVGLDALGPAVVSRVQTYLDLYYQAAAPASPVVNTLWKNNSTNVLQRYNGTSWQTITDSNITGAVTDALTASGTNLTDNKIRIYYQTGAPTGQVAADTGNLWYDTDDAYSARRWNGSAWAAYEGDVRVVPPVLDTDGVPPSTSPTPTIIAGFGSYFITWDAISNPDSVVYDVYMDDVTPVVVNTANLLGSTESTFMYTNASPDNVAVADGSTWYFAIMARDPDGLGPISPTVSGGIVKQKIVRTQITDNAIDTPQLNANAVTAGIVASNAVYTSALQADAVKTSALDSLAITSKHTITGPLIQTASGGERVVMRNDGSGGIIEFYNGISGETPGKIDPSVLSGTYPQMYIRSGTSPSFPNGTSIGFFAGDNAGTNSHIDISAKNVVVGSMYDTAQVVNIANSGITYLGTTQITGNGLTISGGLTFNTPGQVNLNGTVNLNGNTLSMGGGTLQLGSGALNVNTGSINMNGQPLNGLASLTVSTGGITTNGPMHADSMWLDGATSGVTTTATIGTSKQIVRTSSTRTLKKNIQDLDVSAEAIFAMRPRSFKYKGEYAKHMGPRTYSGFIAEELADLGLEIWVIRDEEGNPVSIDYLGLTSGLLLGLQALKKEVDELRGLLGG